MVVVPYVNSLENPFIWDDSNAIVNNPTIRSLWPPWAPLQPPAETPVSTRPLVNLSFALNYAVHGLDVRGYHLVNLGVHLLTACLLFATLRRALATGTTNTRSHAHSSLIALLATLVWAVHPMLSEVVNYSTQRSDALGGAWLMATLFAAQRALETSHRTRWQVMAVIACACGMLSKEFVAVTPLIVLLYDRVFAFPSFREAIDARKRLYMALAATWIPLAAILALRPHSTIGFAAGVDAWTYALNQAEIIVHYLRLAVWPDALVLDYGLPRPLTLGAVWGSALAVVALFAASLAALYRWPRFGFPCVVFFILLAPTSSVIPIASEVGAERRMYLALAALTILGVLGGAWAIDRVREGLPRRAGAVAPAVAAALAFGWIGILGTLTMRRNSEFASPVTLWKTSVDRWPQGRARASYAAALSDEGHPESAIDQLRLALRDFPRARFRLGLELKAVGRYQEAERELTAFIAAEPRIEDQLPARTLLADIRVATRPDEATAEFRRLVDLFPSNPVPRERLAMILLAEGNAPEAAVHYRELLRHSPSNVGWRLSLGRALGLNRQFDEAAAAYRHVLDLDPRAVAAHAGLAAALLESGHISEAATRAEAALAFAPDDAALHNILGAARATQGRLDDAIAHFKRAIAMNPNYAEARRNLEQAEGQAEAMRSIQPAEAR